jgi:HK97 family phage portal protein
MAKNWLRSWIQTTWGAIGSVIGSADLLKVARAWGVGYGRLADDDPGILINHDTALTISALYRARDVLAGAFIQTDFRLEEMTPAGLRPLAGHPVDRALRFGFDADMDRSNFLDAIIGHACFKKGGFAALTFDNDGNFENATLLNPDWVYPANDRAGSPGYWYRPPTGEHEWLDEFEVFHLKGPALDGRVGLNWIEIGKRSLGLAVATERYAAKFFRSGYHLAGVLNLPGNLKKEKEQEIMNELSMVNSGVQNAHGILKLTGEAKFTPSPLINANDAQLLGMRGFNVYEISRWTGVPPSKLYTDKGSTYNGSEQEGLEFAQNCLGGWIRRFVDQVRMKMIPRERWDDWTVTHDLSGWRSADSLTATRTEALRINWGMSTPNRSIRRLGLGADLPGGDVPMRPANMAAADVAPNAAPGGSPSVVVDPLAIVDPSAVGPDGRPVPDKSKTPTDPQP